MKIRIEEDPSAEDLEITIRCRQTGESVIRILEMLRMTDQKLTGHRDGRTYILDVEQIDLADAITAFSWDQFCYNSALKVGNQLLSQSLLDYMG